MNACSRWTSRASEAACIIAVILIASCSGRPAADPASTGQHPGNDAGGGSAPTPPTPQPRIYDALELSDLAGPGSVILAEALDDEGRVAGRICDAPPFCATMTWDAFLWDGSLRRFSVPAGWSIWVSASSGGRIAGVRQNPLGDVKPFISKDDQLVELDSPGGSAAVTKMNSAGTLVGGIRRASGETHAAVWDAGSVTDLGTLTGQRDSLALAIDEAGAIAVLACDVLPSSHCHAVLFRGSSMLDLGELPEGMNGFAMNTAGMVAGGTPGSGPYGGLSAATWSAGTLTNLETPVNAVPWPGIGLLHPPQPGRPLFSSLAAIAENGDAVGGVSVPISEGGAVAAMLWKNGALVDLASVVEPAVPLHSAFAINAKGQILVHEHETMWGQVLLTPR